MSYIAFFDMVGTRASALISNEEYTDAINDFNNSLKQIGSLCPCTIYGYSDNAYAEIEELSDLVEFFRLLRDNLINKHRYFTAAVDCGSLKPERISLGNKNSFSMKFTAPTTIDIYMKQCHFSGIGILLSRSVVDDLRQKGMYTAFCESVYQQYPVTENDAGMVPIYDLSYRPVIFEKLEYIIADYLMTAATSERAGRYYITPAISMIKCLDKSVLLDNLEKLIKLLSFSVVPEGFRCLPHNEKYSQYFMFALIEYVLSLREHDKSIDAIRICEKIIQGYQIEYCKLVAILPTISTAVISNKNKRMFLNILYNMKPLVVENAKNDVVI